MAADFVKRLLDVGHTVHGADFVGGRADDITEPVSYLRLRDQMEEEE